MNRLLACSSIIALCAGLAMPSAYADDAKPQPAPAAAASYPETLAAEIARAKSLRESGRYAEAAKALRQLMLVAGSDPRVVGEYGKALSQQGYAKDAVEALSKATLLSGGDWTLYSALGVAYDQLDKHSEARKAYDRALAMKPGEPSVTNNYAVSRMLTGDYDGAIQMLAGLHSTDPKIEANLAKAQELKAAHQPTTLAAQAEPQKAPTATLAAAATSKQGVSVQPLPSDPHTGPVRAASNSPRALEKNPVRPVLAAEAAKLHVNQSSIVMQKVPVDPQAGPVKTAQAKTGAKKPSAQMAASKANAKSAAPSLRTASD